MEIFVDKMISLNEKLKNAKTSDEISALERKINSRYREIDNITYQLCELTPEEIRIVEGIDA